MSEAMTTELIVEADWLLKGGYWTKTRFPVRTANGRWSDVDVLAYSPARKHLVVSESKVQGPKNRVYAYTPSWYLGFLDNLHMILRDGCVFDAFDESVKRITLQLVSNTVLPSQQEAEASLLQYVKQNFDLPSDLRVEAMLDSTLDVLARVIVRERERGQGRRDGHPVIDVARELNRYFAPSIEGAGHGKARTEVKQQGLRSFWEAIAGPDIATLLGPHE